MTDFKLPGIEPEVSIESIAFGPEGIQVSYQDKRDQSPDVGQITTLLINPHAVEVEYRELHEAIIDIIDAAHRVRRAPPDTIRGRVQA